ncbi:hypothetical protein LTR36_003176 [Oleoguttula mirabilis]|uniref:Protein phosphatase methylesterase 1 n=1 Tax=Oleoguttula mirabilis TaxID=1507867 RepID=A0AAV9JX84_9PEZI|nr:hypothetical protein LTR36_003176 [Oleoguttula mirabilis]
MSDLFRRSVDGARAPAAPPPPPPPPPPPRPRPQPIAIPESDEHSSSDSSASSTDSTASVNTVRPTSSREQLAAAPPTHWTNYFAQELYLEQKRDGDNHHDDDDDGGSDGGKQWAMYHVYLTPPTDPRKGPLFICHHGAGASGLSFAAFAQHVRKRMPEAGVLSLEARGHGSTVTRPNDDGEPISDFSLATLTAGAPILDFSLATLTADALAMITLTQTHMHWPALPPSVLIGHSLGGAIFTQLAADFALGPALIGVCVIDVVEGSAIEALAHMTTYLAARPGTFGSVAEAIDWHTRSRTIRDAASARASVPSLLVETPEMPNGDTRYVWRTDLAATSPWWESWFRGMSAKFLAARGAKLLILAGTDRLDKALMIGQMQGKFQLVVIPEAGHFVQEDVPDKTAGLAIEFFRRNDRSAMVLPPKVSELLAQGKKV